ncbi:MAG TPA: hypothetical protein VF469_06965 [Kofleriaceae bacterium]
MLLVERAREPFELVLRLVAVVDRVRLLHRRAHVRLGVLGQMVEHVALLVDLAALNERVVAERLPDGGAQASAAVDH